MWFWLNVPLAVAFVGAWCGIPLAKVLRNPDWGPQRQAATAPSLPNRSRLAPLPAASPGRRHWHWRACSASCPMNGRGRRDGRGPAA